MSTPKIMCSDCGKRYVMCRCFRNQAIALIVFGIIGLGLVTFLTWLTVYGPLVARMSGV